VNLITLAQVFTMHKMWKNNCGYWTKHSRFFWQWTCE